MYTVTINQRDRAPGDRVPQLLRALARLTPDVPLARTVGDEVQGVFSAPEPAVDAALTAMHADACGGVRWNVGIGVGPLGEPLPKEMQDVTGLGLVYSRRAVERAQHIKDEGAVAVDGPDRVLAAEAGAVLRLLALTVARRTTAEWRVLELLTPGVRGQQKAIAEALGITAQAVSKAIARAHWNEEFDARPAVAHLLRLMLEPH
ncbi:MarR family transcriptional regulator [Sinomonas susongensis]|uniref:MarR family transcriptional regulator n=1 Tax=Sinomonas susongensis TaxID=1324851 RepID=UPI0011089DA6|nr:MarR family transcriptional regulator [Sinomonas susongensis]